MGKSLQVLCGAFVLALTAGVALAQNTPLRVPAITPNQTRSPACQAALDQAMACMQAIQAGTNMCSLEQSNTLNAQANLLCFGTAPQAPPTTRSQPDRSTGKGLPR
jgi:hypothetical protein